MQPVEDSDSLLLHLRVRSSQEFSLQQKNFWWDKSTCFFVVQNPSMDSGSKLHYLE